MRQKCSGRQPPLLDIFVCLRGNCLFTEFARLRGVHPFAGNWSVCGEFIRLRGIRPFMEICPESGNLSGKRKFVRKAEICLESGNLSGKRKFVRKAKICPESGNMSGKRKSRIPELYKAGKLHPGGDSSARERKETGDAEK